MEGRTFRRITDHTEGGGTREGVEGAALMIDSSKINIRGTEIGMREEEDFMGGDTLVNNGDRGIRKTHRDMKQIELSSLT
jgi:hypothetical protein